MQLSIITINRNNASGLEKTSLIELKYMSQEDLYTEYKQSFYED